MFMLIQKLKIIKKLMNEIIKKFELYENFENIKLPNQFTFKSNKNLIKSNISKKKFKSLLKKQKLTLKKVIFFK